MSDFTKNFENFYFSIGKILKEYRQEYLAMTLTEVSSESGVSCPVIMRAERDNAVRRMNYRLLLYYMSKGLTYEKMMAIYLNILANS